MPEKKESRDLVSVVDAAKIIASQKTPINAIRQRRGADGRTYNYVEHGWVTKQLNLAFGHLWNWEIVNYDIRPNEVIVKGKLTIVDRDGNVRIVKEQFGTKQIQFFKGTQKPVSLGDNLKGASSDALKKCASLIGLALDLYTKDEEDVVISKAEKINVNDLKRIWMFGRDLDAYDEADPEEERKAEFKEWIKENLGIEVKSFSELSKEGGQILADRLEELAKPKTIQADEEQ